MAALVIFAAGEAVSRIRPPEDTIRISRADLERLAGLYAMETGAPQAPDALQALLADQVETLALAREARRLGLEEGDVIIERRLAQKMRFMVDDLSEAQDPDEAMLRRWFEDNRAAFAVPALYSFEHVYFRDSGDERIEAALRALRDEPEADWRAMGDAFMLQRRYGEVPAREITRLFGAGFAEGLEALAGQGGWQGPVRSVLGAHLVRLTHVAPAGSPDYETVRMQVLERWREEARLEANARAVAEITARYRVEIEGLSR